MLTCGQALDLLNRINNSSLAERLESLKLDCAFPMNDLRIKGTIDSILEKAVNLKSLSLPSDGDCSYKNINFRNGGFIVTSNTDISLEFLRYLVNSKRLVKHFTFM